MDRDAAMTIVGITGNVKDSPTDAQAPPAIYAPFLQNPSFGNYVVLRAATDSAALAGAVREVARRVGNDFSIQEVRPMEDVVAAAVATERFALQMVGLFAAIALALALIGVYGVISYTVSRRSREIAIRSAIGAPPADTLRLLLGQTAKPILAGLIVGALASASLTRVLAGILYQVSARDPLTFAVVARLLAVGALAACLMPVRRALRLDPMAILRHE
jgi:putative ABC transport system permease protein